MPKNTSAGTTHERMSRSSVLSWTWLKGTPYFDRRSATSGSTRLATTVLLRPSGLFSLPVMSFSPTATSAMRPSASSFSNSL